ncbi:glutathione S-transferase N-terminal domain-containing protein [Algiphilus sp.]|uniref:glutathione S-transferase N-terminal domain-containing protein n=1 Tax=Algiphilus sp. TaxID=1872431 RepID=UPI0025BDE3CC|nr:glutathione S-transferase N-terminal domain-containing protein [Algiphilus sp.]MCK5770318.1 glutathione S-transferase N-terminal domain-containing protein [Algiphilus sp.]
MAGRNAASVTGPTPASALAARRAGLLLFSGEDHLGSHWARLILCEKDVDGVAIEWIKGDIVNEDWMTLSPRGELPTLADREVVLYPARLVVEYLDERYPHPPLLPVEPASRARVRMVQHHISTHLYDLAEAGLASGQGAQKARKALEEELIGLARMFPARGFFMGNEMTVVDTAWAPLMWRLPSLGIALDSVDGMRAYADRLFARGAFQRSLSSVERNLAA